MKVLNNVRFDLNKLIWLLIRATAIGLISVALALELPGIANPSSELNSLPVRIWEIPGNDQQKSATRVLLPDWSQISFSSFPPVSNSSSWGDRSWSQGNTPDQILQLGDISEALKPEILSLESIEQLAAGGTNLENISLAAFPLLGRQKVEKLIQIVPNLSSFKLKEVVPLESLASQTSLINVSNAGELPLSQVMSKFPQFAEASLNQIDLSGFSLMEIPSLSSVNLEQFEGWRSERIADIPLLNQVPLSSFPIPVGELGLTAMRIDMIYGTAESKRSNTISGSNVEGFAVACEKDCAYIELDDLENSGRKLASKLEGKQWISGKYQEVQGGSGCLAGWEPTGRHPFGDAFKVVVMEPSETSDTVDTALYFRFSLPCGKSPYIIGPFPFLSYQTNSPIFVGKLEGGASNSISRPTDAVSSPKLSKPKGSNQQPSQLKQNRLPTKKAIPESKGDCAQPATYINNVDVAALSEAIANLESAGSGDYEAIGTATCADGSRNCGWALGRYQFMSYREDVQEAIASVPGGAEFLKKVSSGTQPTSEELFQYFPPAVQDRVLQNSLAESVVGTQQEIDPKTRQLFSGDRLIERVAQKHFGGSSSKVDASYSDILGGYSLKQYGEKVKTLYNYNRNNSSCISSSISNHSGGETWSWRTRWLPIAATISMVLGSIKFFRGEFSVRPKQSFLLQAILGLAVAIAATTLAH